MANTRDVLVAGGGIAGLAVALAVRRAAPMARVAVADPAFADPPRTWSRARPRAAGPCGPSRWRRARGASSTRSAPGSR